jgi:hypothetical protein
MDEGGRSFMLAVFSRPVGCRAGGGRNDARARARGRHQRPGPSESARWAAPEGPGRRPGGSVTIARGARRRTTPRASMAPSWERWAAAGMADCDDRMPRWDEIDGGSPGQVGRRRIGPSRGSGWGSGRRVGPPARPEVGGAGEAPGEGRLSAREVLGPIHPQLPRTQPPVAQASPPAGADRSSSTAGNNPSQQFPRTQPP